MKNELAKVDGFIFEDNRLINACYDLSETQHRVLNLLISKVNGKDITEISLTVAELHKAIGNDLHDKDNLIKMLAGFNAKPIILRLEEEYILISWWLTWIEFDKGVFTLKLSDKIVPYLHDLKENFTVTSFSAVKELEGKHSVRFYKLLNQFRNLRGDFKVRELKISDLKWMLIPEKDSVYHKDTAFFMRDVVLPAVQDLVDKYRAGKINLKLEIVNTEADSEPRKYFEVIKKGKSIQSLRFTYSFDKVAESTIAPPTKGNKSNVLVEDLVGYFTVNYQSKYSMEYIGHETAYECMLDFYTRLGSYHKACHCIIQYLEDDKITKKTIKNLSKWEVSKYLNLYEEPSPRQHYLSHITDVEYLTDLVYNMDIPLAERVVDALNETGKTLYDFPNESSLISFIEAYV